MIPGTETLNGLPRQRLGFFPTPLVRLQNLEKVLGAPKLLMKRDDQTGLGLGGNKTRKLEFLIGEAIALGADAVITAGAAQSNHCRQTAAAAAQCGLECHLALGGTPPAELSGNLLLNTLFGAEIHWSGEMRKGENIPTIVAGLQQQGKKPYIIPYGGSNETGASGFVAAMIELQQQLAAAGEQVDHIVFASSSGGTHSGMMVGRDILGAGFQLIGVNIDKDEVYGMALDKYIIHLANTTANHLKLNSTFSQDDVQLSSDYLGDGYGVIGDLEREAISLTAGNEGILLDPVYTGRAMGGLIDMIRKGRFTQEETILFWHTGGSPALFAYGDDLR